MDILNLVLNLPKHAIELMVRVTLIIKRSLPYAKVKASLTSQITNDMPPIAQDISGKSILFKFHI